MGERLVDGEYERIALHYEDDGRVSSHSEILNLDMWWGRRRTAFLGSLCPKGWLLSHEEEKERGDDAETRAYAAENRADTEDARAPRR